MATPTPEPVPTRPDPNTVDHVHVATAARQKVAELTDQLLLRDAKVQEVHVYASALEKRLEALEAELAAKVRELEETARRRVGRAIHRGADMGEPPTAEPAQNTQG